MRLIAELERDLANRSAEGLVRHRRVLASAQGPHVSVEGRRVLAFASNDYLGLAQHPSMVAATRDALQAWGVGSGASHLVSGHFAPHEALEAALAEFVAPCAEPRALVFATGYLANLAILTTLAGRNDAIFADRLNHACLNDGALLSRARLVRYPHGDMQALEQLLARSTARRHIIATDAVFSMDGDIAPLKDMLALAERFDAMLVIDDAHGFGVLGEGRGSAAELGINSDRLVVMGTLGKAAGVAGAFVAGHRAVIQTLLQTARSYIYTTAAPPALACATLQSLALIREGHVLRAHLAQLIMRLQRAAPSLPWRLLASSTAIQPLMLGGNETAVALSETLWRGGIWVPAIRPPTVPAGTARLRISLSAAHSTEDVDTLIGALMDAARDADVRRDGVCLAAS